MIIPTVQSKYSKEAFDIAAQELDETIKGSSTGMSFKTAFKSLVRALNLCRIERKRAEGIQEHEAHFTFKIDGKRRGICVTECQLARRSNTNSASPDEPEEEIIDYVILDGNGFEVDPTLIEPSAEENHRIINKIREYYS